MKILISLFLMFIASSVSALVQDDYYGTSSTNAVVTDSRTASRDRTVRIIGNQSASQTSAKSAQQPAPYYAIARPMSMPETSEVASMNTRVAAKVPELSAEVPEPSAIALMGLGLFGLILLRRKVKS